MTARETGYLPVPGGRLYYEAEGAGSPVVMSNGFTLDTRMWAPQVPALAPNHRVIRYDLRGMGRSDPPTGPFTYWEDLGAVLDHLGIGKAHIMGLSRGGSIAVDFAIACPERTLSLVPVGTAVLGGYPMLPRLAAMEQAIGEAAAAGDMALAKRLWSESEWIRTALENPASAGAMRAMLDDYSGWHFLNPSPVVAPDPPAIDRLDEITAPTLVIVGERDVPDYNLPITDLLADRIAGARKLVIAGAGHMTNMEVPEAFNAAVQGFLAEVDA